MPKMTCPAELNQLDGMLEFIDEFIHQLGVDEDRAYKVRLAAEEVLVNIIHYAYPEVPGEIRINCFALQEGTRGLCIEIRDEGIPFNILEKLDPDLTVPVEEREIGGLGIFLTRKIMDEIKYTRTDEENIVLLIKHY